MPRPVYSTNQRTFAARLTGATGLDAGVVFAWMAAEEPVGADTNTDPSGHGAQNWLNIGITGNGNYGYANECWTDPAAAGLATADWLKGKPIGAGGYTSTGYPTASSGIQHILDHTTESPQAQLQAIASSGWAASGYPLLYQTYNQTGQYATVAPVNPAQQTAPQDAAGPGVFQVGDTTNPTEDFWSGINRLAGEVNWYVYTRTDAPDGVLFIADGTWLMQQDPIVKLDRWRDQHAILSLNFTWDNTAFDYTRSKAKKKGTSKKTNKSRVAKVTSPTECTLTLICNIDAFHPGDIMSLTSCGPGSGPWLVAEKRRSIFDVFSEFTLTPAIAPITITGHHDTTENLDSSTLGSTGPGASSSAGSPGQPGPVDTNGLANLAPGVALSAVGDGWMARGGEHHGVDIGMPGGTKLHAICDGTITNEVTGWSASEAGSGSWGPGTADIVLKSSVAVGGFPAGTYFGYGHSDQHVKHVGDAVKAGDVIGYSGCPSGGCHCHFFVNTSTGSGDGNTDPSPIARASLAVR